MELTEEELIFNKIKKGLYNKSTLQKLKSKYKSDYMQQAINEKLKEIENEHDR